MKKSTRIASYIAVFGVVFASGLMVGNALPGHNLATNLNGGSTAIQSTSNSGDLDLKTLWEVRKMLQSKYIHADYLKDQEMTWGAIRGMVAALNDPYTEYMDPKESKQFDESLNSELQGIGAELTVRKQVLTVVSTLKDSPAQKAGILADDIVYKIDGKETSEMTLYEAIMKIRGEQGTSVTLTIIRNGKDKPFEVKVVRDKLVVASVTSEEVEKGIWHVSINQFSDDTKAEFNKILDEIKTKKPKGIILDLRFNGGGYLNGAVEILSSFIKSDVHVVTIEYKDQKMNEKLKTAGSAQFPDLPLVVLINKGSASASEIVALAIQELKRGVLIGEQSFGKGTVQEVDQLADGSSLRYTIAKWNAPSGKNINGEGIKPDQIVELKQEDVDKKVDTQLKAAVNYLKKL